MRKPNATTSSLRLLAEPELAGPTRLGGRALRIVLLISSGLLSSFSIGGLNCCCTSRCTLGTAVLGTAKAGRDTTDEEKDEGDEGEPETCLEKEARPVR